MEENKKFDERSSKWKYKEGDSSLDGSIISHIIGREEDFIVFCCSDGAIGWEHVAVPEWSYPALQEYEKVGSKIKSYLGGFHKDEIKSCMAICLLNTFRLKESGNISAGIEQFKPAIQLIKDLEGRNILYTGPDFYIYQKNDQIDIQCADLNKELEAAKIQASHLYIQAKHSLTKKQLEHAEKLISSDIAEHKEKTPSIPFDKSKSFIENTSKQNMKITYLELSIAFGFIYSVISFLIYKGTELHTSIYGNICLCSIAGVVGAVVSILQRNQSIDVEPFASKWFLSFQGITRIILGMLFGGTVLIAAKANIALGLASNNIYAIVLLAFVAGLNERFVPDLLENNLK